MELGHPSIQSIENEQKNNVAIFKQNVNKLSHTYMAAFYAKYVSKRNTEKSTIPSYIETESSVDELA